MKTSYLVQTFGFWGRGKTVLEAAQQCFRAGAKGKDLCAVNKFTHPTEDPLPEVRHGGLTVSYRNGSTNDRIMEQVTLRKLLKPTA